jgi:aspartate dehydrogenase
LKLKPDVVVEAASQQAVRDWGETILKKGIDLMVIATGAYGDPKLYKKHIKAAEKSGARLRPAVGRHRRPRRASGHAAGQARAREVRLDQAAACLERHAGRDRVRPAVDQGADRDLPRQARRCRPALPKNANLAVTVALCGAGLQHTDIELVADPTLPAGTNASRLEVVSDSGELKMERLGLAMPDNPKTGVLTALTMADDLMKIVRSSDW